MGDESFRKKSSMVMKEKMKSGQTVVFVSSAMVYGPSVNNPVPLTEEAVLRPDVEFVFARQLATAEATVDEWRQSRAGRGA